MQSFYDLDTPALIVDCDRLERNITRMSRRAEAGGKRLMPHAKTHKCPEIARLQLAAGAAGLTLAKVSEAEVMADLGVNLFIANQLVGPHKLERLTSVLRRVPVRIAIDGTDTLPALAAAAAAAGTQIELSIEADTGLGRAGVRSEGEAVELAREISARPGLHLHSIFTYEGHVMRLAEEHARAAAAAAVAKQLRHLAEALAAAGTPVEHVSVGSTPASQYMAGEPGITEMRCGVYVFNDRMEMRLGVPEEDCALSVLTTVISVRTDGRIIVDAGTKSLAGDCPFEDRTYGSVIGWPSLKFAAASEEHGHLQLQEGRAPRVGEKLRIIPNHACTCINMHNQMTAVRNEAIEAVWPIATRGCVQ
ncbi:MAG: alanine racemase [Armatimonadetes bacterium]|nr:alanine racemase [Armatimonadota bacterium]MDE2205419.1 alanine racemase [Armatimonadota bacterium]